MNAGETCFMYYLTRQAKDREGHWVDLEKKASEIAFFQCVREHLTLKPNEIIISKAVRYSGNYYTECRFAFGKNGNTVYSNTFMDYIDESMLTRVAIDWPEKDMQ